MFYEEGRDIESTRRNARKIDKRKRALAGDYVSSFQISSKLFYFTYFYFAL